MRDYELVELKLGVARDEGCSGNPGCAMPAAGVHIDPLIPGVSALVVPVGDIPVRMVTLTDDFDLNLLGFHTGPRHAVLLLHEDDLAWLQKNDIAIMLDGFEQKGALPGWYFLPFPWSDSAAVEASLQSILPGYAAT